jgi:hypothetical protein
MKVLNLRITPGLFALGALALFVSVPPAVAAQAPAVDPSATRILKRMTDHLAGLKRFSVHTQVTLEDVTDSEHRIDLDVSASVIIDRPNKLRAERRGEPIDQTFYYDGKNLTIYNPGEKVYATEPAPETIEGVLDYTRESLGLIVPVADLVYRNAFELLMQDVNFATVVGKSVIDGVSCDHLLFSRPGVDFQVWVANGAEALPCKYVVTDRAHPGWVSITTVMSDWNLAPAIADNTFTFVPPQGAKPIEFMRLDAPSTSIR